MKEPLLVRLSKLEKQLRDVAEQFIEPDAKARYLERANAVAEATELLRRLASLCHFAEDACL